MANSFTEENYLKIIHMLSARSEAGVSTNALAESTATRAASVTDMLRKLSEKGLVHYKKYQGVRLTEEGKQVALNVIRKHRLWEVFLVDKLGFGWDEVHDIAEELEHIPSDRLIERLDAFLGHPQFDPHGDPIPNADGIMPRSEYIKLTEITAGTRVVVVGVSADTPSFLQHLDRIGLAIGGSMDIREINSYDRSILASLGDQGTALIFITHEVAQNILVTPASSAE